MGRSFVREVRADTEYLVMINQDFAVSHGIWAHDETA